MNVLECSSWRNTGDKFYVQDFLSSIGVSFQRGRKRNGFWKTNESKLEHIFHDLCERGREIKIQLHPQSGGDAQEFGSFVTQFDKAKELFYKRGGIRFPGDSLIALQKQEIFQVKEKHRARSREARRREKRNRTKLMECC